MMTKAEAEQEVIRRFNLLAEHDRESYEQADAYAVPARRGHPVRILHGPEADHRRLADPRDLAPPRPVGSLRRLEAREQQHAAEHQHGDRRQQLDPPNQSRRHRVVRARQAAAPSPSPPQRAPQGSRW